MEARDHDEDLLLNAFETISLGEGNEANLQKGEEEEHSLYTHRQIVDHQATGSPSSSYPPYASFVDNYTHIPQGDPCSSSSPLSSRKSSVDDVYLKSSDLLYPFEESIPSQHLSSSSSSLVARKDVFSPRDEQSAFTSLEEDLYPVEKKKRNRFSDISSESSLLLLPPSGSPPSSSSPALPCISFSGQRPEVHERTFSSRADNPSNSLSSLLPKGETTGGVNSPVLLLSGPTSSSSLNQSQRKDGEEEEEKENLLSSPRDRRPHVLIKASPEMSSQKPTVEIQPNFSTLSQGKVLSTVSRWRDDLQTSTEEIEKEEKKKKGGDLGIEREDDDMNKREGQVPRCDGFITSLSEEEEKKKMKTSREQDQQQEEGQEEEQERVVKEEEKRGRKVPISPPEREEALHEMSREDQDLFNQSEETISSSSLSSSSSSNLAKLKERPLDIDLEYETAARREKAECLLPPSQEETPTTKMETSREKKSEIGEQEKDEEDFKDLSTSSEREMITTFLSNDEWMKRLGLNLHDTSTLAPQSHARRLSPFERMLLNRDERRLSRSLRSNKNNHLASENPPARSPSSSVSEIEKDEENKRESQGKSEEERGGGDGREEGEKSIDEQLAEARSLAEAYCFTFNCTYTCGLLFQARLLLRFFATSSSSSSRYPLSVLLNALHAFRRRYTSLPLAAYQTFLCRSSSSSQLTSSHLPRNASSPYVPSSRTPVPHPPHPASFSPNDKGMVSLSLNQDLSVSPPRHKSRGSCRMVGRAPPSYNDDEEEEQGEGDKRSFPSSPSDSCDLFITAGSSSGSRHCREDAPSGVCEREETSASVSFGDPHEKEILKKMKKEKSHKKKKEMPAIVPWVILEGKRGGGGEEKSTKNASPSSFSVGDRKKDREEFWHAEEREGRQVHGERCEEKEDEEEDHGRKIDGYGDTRMMKTKGDEKMAPRGGKQERQHAADDSFNLDKRRKEEDEEVKRGGFSSSLQHNSLGLAVPMAPCSSSSPSVPFVSSSCQGMEGHDDEDDLEDVLLTESPSRSLTEASSATSFSSSSFCLSLGVKEETVVPLGRRGHGGSVSVVAGGEEGLYDVLLDTHPTGKKEREKGEALQASSCSSLPHGGVSLGPSGDTPEGGAHLLRHSITSSSSSSSSLLDEAEEEEERGDDLLLVQRTRGGEREREEGLPGVFSCSHHIHHPSIDRETDGEDLYDVRGGRHAEILVLETLLGRCDSAPRREEEERKKKMNDLLGRCQDMSSLLQSLLEYHLPFLASHLHQHIKLSPLLYASSALGTCFSSSCYSMDREEEEGDEKDREKKKKEKDSEDGLKKVTEQEGEEEKTGGERRKKSKEIRLDQEEDEERDPKANRKKNDEDKEEEENDSEILLNQGVWSVHTAEFFVQQLWRFLVLVDQPVAPALVFLALMSEHAAELSCSSSSSSALHLLQNLPLSRTACSDFFGDGGGLGARELVTLQKLSSPSDSAKLFFSWYRKAHLSFMLPSCTRSSSSSLLLLRALESACRVWQLASLYGVQTPRSFAQHWISRSFVVVTGSSMTSPGERKEISSSSSCSLDDSSIPCKEKKEHTQTEEKSADSSYKFQPPHGLHSPLPPPPPLRDGTTVEREEEEEKDGDFLLGSSSLDVLSPRSLRKSSEEEEGHEKKDEEGNDKFPSRTEIERKAEDHKEKGGEEEGEKHALDDEDRKKGTSASSRHFFFSDLLPSLVADKKKSSLLSSTNQEIDSKQEKILTPSSFSSSFFQEKEKSCLLPMHLQSEDVLFAIKQRAQLQFEMHALHSHRGAYCLPKKTRGEETVSSVPHTSNRSLCSAGKDTERDLSSRNISSPSSSFSECVGGVGEREVDIACKAPLLEEKCEKKREEKEDVKCMILKEIGKEAQEEEEVGYNRKGENQEEKFILIRNLHLLSSSSSPLAVDCPCSSVCMPLDFLTSHWPCMIGIDIFLPILLVSSRLLHFITPLPLAESTSSEQERATTEESKEEEKEQEKRTSLSQDPSKKVTSSSSSSAALAEEEKEENPTEEGELSGQHASLSIPEGMKNTKMKKRSHWIPLTKPSHPYVSSVSTPSSSLSYTLLFPMDFCFEVLLELRKLALEMWGIILIDCRTLEDVEENNYIRLAQSLLMDGRILLKNRSSFSSSFVSLPPHSSRVKSEGERRSSAKRKASSSSSLSPLRSDVATKVAEGDGEKIGEKEEVRKNGVAHAMHDENEEDQEEEERRDSSLLDGGRMNGEAQERRNGGGSGQERESDSPHDESKGVQERSVGRNDKKKEEEEAKEEKTGDGHNDSDPDQHSSDMSVQEEQEKGRRRDEAEGEEEEEKDSPSQTIHVRREHFFIGEEEEEEKGEREPLSFPLKTQEKRRSSTPPSERETTFVESSGSTKQGERGGEDPGIEEEKTKKKKDQNQEEEVKLASRFFSSLDPSALSFFSKKGRNSSSSSSPTGVLRKSSEERRAEGQHNDGDLLRLLAKCEVARGYPIAIVGGRRRGRRSLEEQEEEDEDGNDDVDAASILARLLLNEHFGRVAIVQGGWDALQGSIVKEGVADQLLVYTGVDAAGRGGGASGGFDLAEGAASIAVASAHAIQDWGLKAKETAKEWMSTHVLSIKKTGGHTHLSIKKWRETFQASPTTREDSSSSTTSPSLPSSLHPSSLAPSSSSPLDSSSSSSSTFSKIFFSSKFFASSASTLSKHEEEEEASESSGKIKKHLDEIATGEDRDQERQEEEDKGRGMENRVSAASNMKLVGQQAASLLSNLWNRGREKREEEGERSSFSCSLKKEGSDERKKEEGEEDEEDYMDGSTCVDDSKKDLEASVFSSSSSLEEEKRKVIEDEGDEEEVPTTQKEGEKEGGEGVHEGDESNDHEKKKTAKDAPREMKREEADMPRGFAACNSPLIDEATRVKKFFSFPSLGITGGLKKDDEERRREETHEEPYSSLEEKREKGSGRFSLHLPASSSSRYPLSSSSSSTDSQNTTTSSSFSSSLSSFNLGNVLGRKKGQSSPTLEKDRGDARRSQQAGNEGEEGGEEDQEEEEGKRNEERTERGGDPHEPGDSREDKREDKKDKKSEEKRNISSPLSFFKRNDEESSLSSSKGHASSSSSLLGNVLYRPQRHSESSKAKEEDQEERDKEEGEEGSSSVNKEKGGGAAFSTLLSSTFGEANSYVKRNSLRIKESIKNLSFPSSPFQQASERSEKNRGHLSSSSSFSASEEERRKREIGQDGDASHERDAFSQRRNEERKEKQEEEGGRRHLEERRRRSAEDEEDVFYSSYHTTGEEKNALEVVGNLHDLTSRRTHRGNTDRGLYDSSSSSSSSSGLMYDPHSKRSSLCGDEGRRRRRSGVQGRLDRRRGNGEESREFCLSNKTSEDEDNDRGEEDDSGVFEIGDEDEDDEEERRDSGEAGGRRGSFYFEGSSVEGVGGEQEDLRSLMKKYEMYIQEVQQLAKGATVDLVELQNQIGDVQIFEALKVRRQGKSRRWKFFIPEGSAGGGDKKSLRWLLLTLNQILVLDPYHSESEHGDTEVSVGGRNSLLHSGSSLEEEKEKKTSSVKKQGEEEDEEARSTPTTSLLIPRSKSSFSSSSASSSKWTDMSHQWRSAVLSFGEKAKDVFQQNTSAVFDHVVTPTQYNNKHDNGSIDGSTSFSSASSPTPSTTTAATSSVNSPKNCFETITGFVHLPSSSRGRHAKKDHKQKGRWVRVKSNHRLNELVKAVYTPDDSLRLTLVYSSGKENTYDLLARSAFLEAVQNRLASISVDIGSPL